MVMGLKKTGDVLARSDLCHLHDGRAEAESCAIDPKLRRQDRDVVLVVRSGSSQHVWVVRRSLSEIINGRLLPKAAPLTTGSVETAKREWAPGPESAEPAPRAQPRKRRTAPPQVVTVVA